MRVKEVEVGISYTWQPEQFHSSRVEVKFAADVVEGDDPDRVFEELRDKVFDKLEETMPAMGDIHTETQKKKHGVMNGTGGW